MAITDLRIGDREVWLGGQKIGYTKGGIEFTFEREFEDLTADEFGTSPVDMALTGHNLLIKFFLAEINTYNLSKAIPESQYNAGAGDDKVGLGSRAGYLLSQDATVMRLHPRNLGPNVTTEDIYIWKAVSAENIEIPFKIDEQTVVEVTMRALVDENRPANSLLGQYGPDAIS